jgi:hypothetical protein
MPPSMPIGRPPALPSLVALALVGGCALVRAPTPPRLRDLGGLAELGASDGAVDASALDAALGDGAKPADLAPPLPDGADLAGTCDIDRVVVNEV